MQPGGVEQDCQLLCDVRFFFQAEDGIRDHCVTGVQTCALPISRVAKVTWAEDAACNRQSSTSPAARSEERRVGKECRSRGRPYPEKKNKDSGLGGRREPYIERNTSTAVDEAPQIAVALQDAADP